MADNYNWIEDALLSIPYKFYYGCAVAYNDKIHILGGYGTSNIQKYHYTWDGTSWVKKTDVPYYFYRGCAVVYDGKIHIFGSAQSSPAKNHYSWDGTKWTQETNIPYKFNSGCAVVYNNKIHLLGGNLSWGIERNHYSWDGTEWVQETDIPYDFDSGGAVVYDGKIHIIGGSGSGNYTKHYSWDGTSWTMEPSNTLHEFYGGAAIVHDNKIHLFGGSYRKYYHSVFNGTSWIEKTYIPYEFYGGCSVVYKDEVCLLGTYLYNYEQKTSKMIFAYNIIKYGDKSIIDLSSLPTTTVDVKKGIYFVDKRGIYVRGTRPSYYKNNSSSYLEYGLKKIFSDPNNERQGILFDGNVSLRVSGVNIQLYGMKTDGVTESSVTIVSNIGANYKYSFIIDRIHYIDEMTVFICYRYQTSDTLFSGDFVRAVIRKYDGTLLLGSAVQITSAPSTSLDCEYFLIRNMFDNQYMWVRKQTTLSNNSAALTAYKVYYTSTTGAITYYNSAYVNVSGSVVRWPDFVRMGEMDRGGFFYKNNSNVYYFCFFYDYVAGARNLTVASSPDLEQHITNPLNAHFLGVDKKGRVVIAEEMSNDPYGSDYMKLLVFDYDNTVTTNNFKYINESTIYGCHINPYTVIDLTDDRRKLPYSAADSVLCEYNGLKYLVGGTGHLRDIYVFEYNYEWVKLDNELPYDFKDGSVLATSYNGVFLLGGNGNGTKFFWAQDFSSEWTELPAIPYSFYQGIAFLNENADIEIIGGYGNNQKHYSYNMYSQTWTALTNWPISVYNATYFEDYSGIKHIFGSQGNNRYHYYQVYDWVNNVYVWKKGMCLLYDVYNSAVVQGSNDYIHIFGGGQEYSKYKHCKISTDADPYIRDYQGITYRESDLPIPFTKPVIFGDGYVDEGYILDLTDNTKCVEFHNPNNIVHIVSFINDVLTLSNRSRFQISYYGTFESIEAVEGVSDPMQVYINQAVNVISGIGPESDPYNGVCIS